MDSGVKNRILGVYAKIKRILFKASSWKIEFFEICNKNVAAAPEGLITNEPYSLGFFYVS